MSAAFEPRTLGLVGGVLILLAVATVVIRALHARNDSGLSTAILETVRMRVYAWWVLCSILAATFFIGQTATVVLSGLGAFWALREFITLTPTRPGDHRTLFLVFFVIAPLQFVLVGMENYPLYSIVIPVYAFLIIPGLIAMAGDHKRFLERTAKIETGLLICVYCLSYAPALLTLRLEPNDLPSALTPGANTRLLFFFVLIVQLSDALQYAWAQIPSRHVIAPAINPTKTWEGLLGGSASVTLIGGVLWWATPFQGSNWWMAAAMSLVISVMGFAGGLTLSAIKRDRGVRDYGTLVAGHGGLLDRIDSLCFSAPVFFHLTLYWLKMQGVKQPWDI
ncbi:MAG: phosphatidate cytidylyltransferase [Planctomycetota bacterium]